MNIQDIPEIYKYLTELDLYSKVQGYSEWSKKTYKVELSFDAVIDGYAFYCEVFSKFKRDSYEDEFEMVEFEIENAEVFDKDGELLFDREDCVIYMNNPMVKFHRFDNPVKNIFRDLYESYKQGMNLVDEINKELNK